MKNTIENMRYNLSASIEIQRSAAEVWLVLKDFNNVYTWAPGVLVSHGIGDVEQEKGAVRYCKLEGFGEIEEKVIAWDEGEGFSYDVTPLGPLDVSVSQWRLSTAPSGNTLVTVGFYYNLRLGVLGKLMHKLLMRKKLETALPQTLVALKSRVETGKLVRQPISA